MLTTLNDRTQPFRFTGDTRLLRVGLTLLTVPGSARVFDAQGITDVVSGVLIEPISRKFPAIGLLRWLDANGRVQGEELRLEFEQTDFYPTVASISGFELWFRKGVTLDCTIENGGGSVGVTDYSVALATLQSSLDAVGVTVDNLAMAVIDGDTDNAPVLAAIADLPNPSDALAAIQASLNTLAESGHATDYGPEFEAIQASLDALLVGGSATDYSQPLAAIQADLDAIQLQTTQILATPLAPPSVVSPAPAQLLGSTGMTQIVSGQADDANINIGNIGFDFPMFGTLYRSNIFVCSNSYITFGFGASLFSNFSATNPGRGILVSAKDRGWYAAFTKTDIPGKSYRIRLEHSFNSSGAGGHIWEITLFNDGYVQIVTSSTFATDGISHLSDGLTAVPFVITPEASYTMKPFSTTILASIPIAANGSYVG